MQYTVSPACPWLREQVPKTDDRRVYTASDAGTYASDCGRRRCRRRPEPVGGGELIDRLGGASNGDRLASAASNTSSLARLADFTAPRRPAHDAVMGLSQIPVLLKNLKSQIP